MKILLIHNYYRQYGGEETYFKILVKILREKKHKTTIYTKNSSEIVGSKDKILAAFSLIFNNKEYHRLSRLLVRERPDIVHINNIYPLIGPAIFWACKKNKIPIVQTIHNYRYLCPKGTLFRKNKVCELCTNSTFAVHSIIYSCYANSRLASLFLTISLYLHRVSGVYKKIHFIFPTEFISKYICDKLPEVKENSIILANPIDEFKPTTQNIDLNDKDYYLCFGRISDEKGIGRLVKNFRYLRDKKLIVVGKNSSMLSTKNTPNIKTIDFITRDKIFHLIKNSLAVILPSLWYEVLPYALLETISMNKAVIVSNKALSIIRSKNLDFKFITYNPDSLSSLKKAISESGKKSFVKTKINISKKYYEKLIKFYEKIVIENK
jgi:glycosyltransferase involved in cell wall biosynthesis